MLGCGDTKSDANGQARSCLEPPDPIDQSFWQLGSLAGDPRDADKVQETA